VTPPTIEPRGVRVPIREEADVAIARRCIHQLAPQGRLSPSATHALATAVSEIARNIVVHASVGELVVCVVTAPDRSGLIVTARDTGPGVPNLERAMQDGYSTVNSLGLGLPSARRLVDAFELVTAPDRGTTITLKKWASQA
jgi:anti-sigma regulatory factor (Ser/Thr protein kinase)